jgi:hypothetical protein
MIKWLRLLWCETMHPITICVDRDKKELCLYCGRCKRWIDL